jgi:hypothetical protein
MTAAAPAPRTRARLGGWALALLPAGFLFGLIGGFLQEHRLVLGQVAVPWASVLVIATLVAVVRAASQEFGSRTGGGLFFTGWALATVLMALPNPSGDLIFSPSLAAYAYLGAGAILGSAAAAWPLHLGPDAPPEVRDA